MIFSSLFQRALFRNILGDHRIQYPQPASSTARSLYDLLTRRTHHNSYQLLSITFTFVRDCRHPFDTLRESACHKTYLLCERLHLQYTFSLLARALCFPACLSLNCCSDCLFLSLLIMRGSTSESGTANRQRVIADICLSSR